VGRLDAACRSGAGRSAAAGNGLRSIGTPLDPQPHARTQRHEELVHRCASAGVDHHRCASIADPRGGLVHGGHGARQRGTARVLLSPSAGQHHPACELGIKAAFPAASKTGQFDGSLLPEGDLKPEKHVVEADEGLVGRSWRAGTQVYVKWACRGRGPQRDGHSWMRTSMLPCVSASAAAMRNDESDPANSTFPRSLPYCANRPSMRSATGFAADVCNRGRSSSNQRASSKSCASATGSAMYAATSRVDPDSRIISPPELCCPVEWQIESTCVSFAKRPSPNHCCGLASGNPHASTTLDSKHIPLLRRQRCRRASTKPLHSHPRSSPLHHGPASGASTGAALVRSCRSSRPRLCARHGELGPRRRFLAGCFGQDRRSRPRGVGAAAALLCAITLRSEAPRAGP
jgi:hypothetical protein